MIDIPELIFLVDFLIKKMWTTCNRQKLGTNFFFKNKHIRKYIDVINVHAFNSRTSPLTSVLKYQLAKPNSGYLTR